MANIKVNVGVSVSSGANGKLEIRIKPWRIHVDPGDTVEWVPVKHNGQDRVKWLRIDTVAHTDPWPFPDVPPDPAYTANKPKHPKTPNGRNGGLPVGTVIPYTIAVAFNDENGDERFASVDPDMVMD
jgi:hypothetical protein